METAADRTEIAPLEPVKHRAPRPPQSRVTTGGVATPISHTVAGTIGELLTAADLSARGFAVFFPLVRTTRMDLVAVSRDGTTMLGIEVRCGQRTADGKVRYSFKTNSPAAHHAIVITGEPVIYEPELPSA